MSWSPPEKAVAETVVKALQSEKYKSKNFLFLLPFNLSEVPGYLELVGKALDLQTVSNNLQQNAYDTPASFWKELSDVFENAVKYHGNRPASQWIAKFAKDMLKALSKEKKAAEKRGKPKLKITKKESPGKQLPDAVNSAAPVVDAALPVVSSAAVAAAPASLPVVKLKPSLKLKLPTQKSKKLPMQKLKLPTQKNKQEAKQPPVKAKPTKTKLKLKMSLSKKATTAVPPAVPPAPTQQSSTTVQIAPAEPTPAAPLAPVPVTEKPKAATPKLSIKLGNSRGKELPKAVQAQQKQASTAPKTTSTSKATGAAKASSSTTKASSTAKASSAAKASSTAKASGTAKVKQSKGASKKAGGGTMTAARLKQCSKVLAALKRREQKQITAFLHPVSDKAILQDYKAKIKHPCSLSTVTTKLEKGSYKKVADFCTDVRRIFANCLRYNTSMKEELRPVAVEVLHSAENLMKFFIAQPEAPQVPPYPPLIYCWKLCIEILNTLFNLVNATDGQPTALYFLYPVSFYCGGKFPPDYLEKVKKPMDFGTVTANLLEGRYKSLDEFATDTQLILSNCVTYYSTRDDGKIYVDHANRLNDYLVRQLEQLARYTKSSRGASDRAKAIQPVSLPKPPPELLLSVLNDLRALKYTDKGTKITEAAMGPFEKPVSLEVFPDYLQHISEPMNLQTVEQKIRTNSYTTPEDFEYDVNLAFKNCESYYSKRNGDHYVAMAKSAVRQFRRVFYAKIRAFEDPGSVAAKAESETPPSPVGPPAKKIKIDTNMTSKGKSAPRISLNVSQLSSAASQARSKSPNGKNASASSNQKKSSAPAQLNPDQPVPLHIAIARVKEAFPLRRALKSLQPWEVDSARYFKELMRHPWVSAARPKFIFHVPVPVLFPELREAYAAKIRKPMDLTTVDCTLLAGNRYASPEDVVNDISLVFANAIRFNKDGRDVGDPLSCAYYDASIHLLKHSRWLSLELLSNYVDDSENVDEPGPDGLPPFSWKLSAGNRRKAREEMEALVLKEPIEKSLEGDRWTWHEAECEKLLKALRHQSDLRHMKYFIQANYPADYTAYIAKPMDWEKVQRTLKKRQYEKFGEVIDDLRLIFSNALKYNARLKAVNTVNADAFNSAQYMSNKLEGAIVKLLLTVADRLERERIDHANAEREIEAQDKAEEAAIRAAWKKEPNKTGLPAALPADAAQKIRLIRSAAKRQVTTDFEIPFFDEEEGGQRFFEVVKLQKAIFEKQRQEISKMRQVSANIGAVVFSSRLQHQWASKWEEEEIAKLSTPATTGEKDGSGGEPDANSNNEGALSSGSNVLSALEKDGRPPVQMKLLTKKAKTTRKKAVKRLLDFD